MPYHSNAARRLERDNRETHQPSNKRQEKPSLRVVQGKRSRVKAIITPRFVFIFFALIAAVCFMVYYQACLTEVTGEINALNRDLRTLKSENVRLQSELEPTQSRRALAEQASKELGMHRVDHHQISYVNIFEEDKVEVATPEESEGIAKQVEAVVTAAIDFFAIEK